MGMTPEVEVEILKLQLRIKDLEQALSTSKLDTLKTLSKIANEQIIERNTWREKVKNLEMELDKVNKKLGH